MGTTNDANRFVLPDNLTQDWLIPYALASGAYGVAVGDLMYDAGSGVAYPADRQSSQGSEAADQALFASKFVGVSQQQVLSTETNALKRLTVRTDCVVEITCVSNTFNPGDMVGIYSTGSTSPDPQKVDKVSNPALAIGVVTKYYGSATTRVQCRLTARNGTEGIASKILAGSGTTATFALPLMLGRTDTGLTMTASAGAGVFGITNSTGTSLALTGEAAQNTTKTDKVLFDVVLPAAYPAAAPITVTVNGKHAESGGTTLTNTVVAKAYVIASNGTSGTDLIGASPSALTGSAADYTFTIPGTSRAAGDHLLVQITAVATEGGNAGTTTDTLNSVRLSW